MADSDFRLRAERAGGGAGRIYTVGYTAVDVSGNVTTVENYVLVPHDQDGVTDPIDIRVEQDESGTAISWGEVPEAQYYNAIRGQLENLADSGPMIGLGPVVCIEAGSVDASTAQAEDDELPEPGSAFFYLVEYSDGTSRSYGSVSAAKPRVPGTGSCEP
jgi:hypothetical protein